MAVKYSFVIPVFNEEESLLELHRRLSGLFGKLDGEAEAILVDDGSSDHSYAMLAALNMRDPRFKVIQFARNFGQQIATTAGLDFAEGEAVIIMDADLQDPPEIVFEMIERWKEGFEVVYGKRRARYGESWFKKITASIFYRLLEKISITSSPKDTGDFRLVDRRVVEAFKTMPESFRYVRGMFSWLGFRQTALEFDRPERLHGETKYDLGRMVKLATDAILSFSYFPLQSILSIGLVLTAASFFGAIGSGLYAVMARQEISIFIWLAFGVIFLAGLQLISLGVVGEYIGRIYEEVKGRPLYVLRNLHGFPANRQGHGRSLFDFSKFTSEIEEELPEPSKHKVEY
ncbi:MAG: glycosyltransferase family 2 protein [Candidatus Caenarcaniphilales bacterium]|nr:glycosyltransferase family 2 protein [Candidatus Caenarcaniphilales bacterium]